MMPVLTARSSWLWMPSQSKIFPKAAGFPGGFFSDATVSAVGSGLQNWGRLQNRTCHVGEALSLPKCTHLSCSMNGETCVGVANLATRHKHPEGALCTAGGFEPPLRVRFRIWDGCKIALAM